MLILGLSLNKAENKDYNDNKDIKDFKDIYTPTFVGSILQLEPNVWVSSNNANSWFIAD